jgi:acyl-CoA reductase-like NAD-dependent aldehyde dehydrogenase
VAGHAEPRRRPLLRMLSYLLAIVILGAHIVTFGISRHHPPWLSLDMRDLLGHSAMFLAFAFLYRYSFTRAASPLAAGLSTVLSAAAVAPASSCRLARD